MIFQPDVRTKRDQVFDFIVSYKRTHDGIAPSNREIMEACHFGSTSVVSYHLDQLVEEQRIEILGQTGHRVKSSRSIRVYGGHWDFKQEQSA